MGSDQSDARAETCPGHESAGPAPLPTYTPNEIYAIFQRFAEAHPDPRTELHYTNNCTLLVAVMLSAQATDVGVNRATRPLFQIADTPQKLLALGETRLRDMIRTIGLYRNKAKNAIALSAMLLDEFDGQVPNTREALERLPGVGRKTANVVLNNAFGVPTIAVDTHLFRLANRLAIAPAKTPLGVELELLRIIPEKFLHHAHHWLILHGRYVCTARRPKCDICRIRDLCKASDNSTRHPQPGQ